MSEYRTEIDRVNSLLIIVASLLGLSRVFTAGFVSGRSITTKNLKAGAVKAEAYVFEPEKPAAKTAGAAHAALE